MSMKLEDLAFKLNTYVTAAGVSFAATFSESGDTLEVVCSANPDAPIVVVASDQQLLSVSPLFNIADVKADMLDELNNTLLVLSPVVPLSALGRQDDNYILFGAMSVNTVFENIAHELEVQAVNVMEVLDALEVYFEPATAEEV